MPALGSNKKDDEVRREKYLLHRLAGVIPTTSAQLAGYKNPQESSKDLERNPRIKIQIQAGIDRQRQEVKWTRSKVLEVVEEAINMGKIIADPAAMIRGAQEINKMQGYYAPETKEVILTDERAAIRDQISNLSEAELLDKLGRSEAYIDAEFEEVRESTESPSQKALGVD